VIDANNEIFRAASVDPLRFGMGSTVVAGVVSGDRLYLGSVGDSRAYLINDSTIYQLSFDHSWVAEQVRAGLITESDARHHPRKNLLTRAVGSSAEVHVDIGTFELVSGDCVLFCTDGLTNLLSDDELVEAIGGKAAKAAALKLVELANERGAPDNVTAVIARVLG
jgi:serine/threonine protein phosphatase PrpC